MVGLITGIRARKLRAALKENKEIKPIRVADNLLAELEQADLLDGGERIRFGEGLDEKEEKA